MVITPIGLLMRLTGKDTLRLRGALKSDSYWIVRAPPGPSVQSLNGGKAVGWMQGRMEFGPRALGNRSILGDARSPTIQKVLNLKVKYRESFRPFAPAVLREDLADWFELGCDSPCMLLVANVRSEHRRTMTEREQAL